MICVKRSGLSVSLVKKLMVYVPVIAFTNSSHAVAFSETRSTRVFKGLKHDLSSLIYQNLQTTENGQTLLSALALLLTGIFMRKEVETSMQKKLAHQRSKHTKGYIQ